MTRTKLAAALLATCLAALAHAAVPQPAGRELLHPFDYQGVRLDPGLLHDQLREIHDTYLNVPDDDLLKGFRRRVGLPAPGNDLPGWYAHDTFHVFGQIVSGLARMYAATGDPAYKVKADHLVAEWANCIEPDGYFFYSRHPNSPHYVYEKTVCGLVDAHRYAHTPGALDALARITTWAEKNLDRSRVYAQHAGGAAGPSQEWYTLSENLYRAYLVTGDVRYRAFAKVWEYTDYWDLYRRNVDIFTRPGHFHAYSHVNTLSGAAMAYRVTGDTSYLDTIVHAYDYLRTRQEYATGGYGPGERLQQTPDLLKSLDEDDRSFETECGAWAGFKLGKYLISFTGDARYGDWVEALAINAICASRPLTPDGHVTYYSQYGLDGGSKVYSAAAWPCCAGTRIQAVADLADLIFFRTDDAFCVNLFTPATCQWRHAGARLTLRQLTTFPEQQGTRLEIKTDRETTFALKLRNPAWLARPMTITVNGRPVPATVDSDHWVSVNRTWHDGDVVDVSLPMSLQAHPFPPSSGRPVPAAITFGPTVLVFSSPDGPPGHKIDFDHLATALTPVPGQSLTFSLAADPAVAARPFYAVPPSERYYMYLDPAYRWSPVPPGRWTTGGKWRSGNPLNVSTDPGAFVETTFDGTGVRWVGRRFNDAGRAEVSVDGKTVAVADQYGPRRNARFTYAVTGLPAGRHTLRITVVDGRNPASTGRFVNVERLEATTAGPATAPVTAQPATSP
jgi:DUF1680 family protein